MTCDVLILRINSPKARPLLARRLARDPSVSVEKALTMLGNLPVMYERAIADTEAAKVAVRLRKMGVDAQIVPSQPATRSSKRPKPGPQPATPRIRRAVLSSSISTTQHGFTAVAQPPRQKKGNLRKQLGALVVAIAIPGILLYLGTRSRIVTKDSRSPSAQAGKTSSSSPRSETRGKAGQTEPSGMQRPGKRTPKSARTSTPAEKRQSFSWTDSARTAPNASVAVNFYKIAISFNKHNVEAWYGLINAYRDLGMHDDAREARREMHEIFGDDITSLTDIVGLFGEAREITHAENQTLRLEYDSRVSGREDLTKEVYRLAKALRGDCGCEAVSVHAHSGKMEGLLVYSTMKPFPSSLRSFKETAKITYLR